MANYLTTDTELQSVANAIRTKGGTSNQLEYPTGFVSAIENISTGGLGPNDLHFSGNLMYFNTQGYFSKILKDNKDNIEISNITSLQSAFSNLPNNEYKDLSYLDGKMSYYLSGDIKLREFGQYSPITKLPSVLPLEVPASSSLTLTLGNYSFFKMTYIKNFDNFLKEKRVNVTGTITDVCNGCYRLRSFNKNFWYSNRQEGNGNGYKGWFCDCYVLDNLENIPVFPENAGVVSSGYNDFLENGNRLNKITFATDNGTPYNINITKNLTWDLSANIGYSGTRDLTAYDMSAEKEVTDATSYNLLKDDPDWWTKDVAYSRFNHDSAVALINSLPNNTNASYKVTIKLKGDAGSATDGGAISTLTAEEIAVATNKNWTISIV